ncbi:hypothetical protein CHH26_05065 [Qipengyuania flava]|nr:hypothetical protein CHH26_05065 [Qipengyuania flava]
MLYGTSFIAPHRDLAHKVARSHPVPKVTRGISLARSLLPNVTQYLVGIGAVGAAKGLRSRRAGAVFFVGFKHLALAVGAIRIKFRVDLQAIPPTFWACALTITVIARPTFADYAVL